MTKYTTALTSCGTVHYNGWLVIVFTFETVIFTKNTFPYIFKVIENAHVHVNSPLPHTKVNATKTKHSIY